MKVLASLCALTAAAALTNCAGYHVGADKPAKMAKVTKLAVPAFKNQTLVPRLEVLTTNALIKKLQTQGTYKIVDREDADAVLTGEITDIQRSQFRAVRTDTLRTSEILMRLRLNYKVEDKDGVVLMTGQKIGYSNLVLDPNFQLTQTQVLADAAERLALDLCSELTEGW